MRPLQNSQTLHFRRCLITVAEVGRGDRTANLPGADSLEAYPNITAAAEMLGVSPSTISRRADLRVEARGERDRVLTPGEVLRLGRIFRKRSINDVAQALLDHAAQFGTEARARVEDEVERHFDEHTVAGRVEQLRRLARQMLPPELAEQVEATLDEGTGDMPTLVEGYVPLEAEE